MKINLTCPKGHEFAADAEAAASGTTCPDCGGSVRWSESETPHHTQGEPTVSHVPAVVVPAVALGSALPRWFGRFELLDEVGHGGYGTVYRAHDPQLDREVAIKLPRAGVLVDDQDVDRFLREARAAGRLRHPSIVPVYDAGQIDGVCYIASGFVRGRTLSAALRQSGVFSPRDAAALISKLAAALHYAHTQGVIHRDVKPGNVMLDERGEPHMLDFGLARRFEGEALRTQEGTRMGTPAYMSPEQAEGKSHLADARSDLWALGVMLYEFLAGRRPFRGRDLDLLVTICTQEPTPPRRFDKHIPRDLETICLKCLAKDPTHRYASCEELAEELQRYLRGEPIRARRIGQAERAWRWCRRKPALAGMLGAAAILLVAAGGISAYHLAFRSASEWEVQQLRQNVSTKTAEIHTARQSVAVAKSRTDEERKAKQRQLVEKLLVQALEECKSGDIDIGVLRMVFALDHATNARTDELEHALRHNIAAWSRELSTLEHVLAHPLRTPVFCGQASDDGSKLVVSNGVASVWDLEQGRLVATAVDPRADSGTAVSWGPDSTNFVTVGLSSVASWDALSGALRWVQRAGAGRWTIVGSAFSRDRRLVATLGHDGQIRIWNTLTGDLVASLDQKGPLKSAAFSPDGTMLATGGHIGTSAVRLWDTGSWRPIACQFPSDPPGEQVLFTSDSARLLVQGGWVQLHDTHTAEQVGQRFLVVPHATGILGDYSVAMSPDDRLAAARDPSNAVQLFNLPSAQQRGQPLKHENTVFRMVFSPDSNRLLTSSQDGTARLWDTTTTKTVGQPLRHGEHGVALAGFVGETGRCFTGDWGGGIRIWETPRQKSPREQPIAIDGGILTAKLFKPNYLITCSAPARAIQLWNIDDGGLLCGAILPFTATPSALAISGDGQRLAVGYVPDFDAGFQVQLVDAGTGASIGAPLTLAGVTGGQLEFSPDGRVLVVKSLHMAISRAHLFDLGVDGLVLRALLDENAPVEFSPGGTAVLGQQSRSAYRLFSWKAGEQQGPSGDAIAVRERPLEIKFSGNGRVLTFLYRDGGIESHDSRTGARVGPPILQVGGGAALAVSENGKLVAVADPHGSVHLWDIRAGCSIGAPWSISLQANMVRTEVTRASSLLPRVHDLAFSSDDQELVVAYSDHIVRHWPVPQPINGSGQSLRRQFEIRTGVSLGDNDDLTVLEQDAWTSRGTGR